MKRFIAMMAALVCTAAFACADAQAFGRGGWGGVPSPYYYDSWHRYQFNPYVAPLPAYGILPQPLATYQMLYGRDPYHYWYPEFLYSAYSGDRYRGDNYGDRNNYGDRRAYRSTEELDYVPRKRPSLYPAIPFNTPAPGAKELDVRRARFEITVPDANAIIWFDGIKMTQTGLTRTFFTPTLPEDKLYSATVEAEWRDSAGNSIRAKHTFDFVAGETKRHTFTK